MYVPRQINVASNSNNVRLPLRLRGFALGRDKVERKCSSCGLEHVQFKLMNGHNKPRALPGLIQGFLNKEHQRQPVHYT